MADSGVGRARSVCLFCSAREPLPEAARALAADFGAACAAQRWRLVYGGSSRGLMGVAARAAVSAGGDVLGIMPRHLVRSESAAAELGTLTLVNTLAERKQLMAEASDVFVALPGGIGTLDETAEMLTLNDLGLQEKPVLLCASDGFWLPFATLIERFDTYGVLRPGFARHLRFTGSAEETVRLIRDYFAATAGAAPEGVAPRGV